MWDDNGEVCGLRRLAVHSPRVEGQGIDVQHAMSLRLTPPVFWDDAAIYGSCRRLCSYEFLQCTLAVCNW